jgi:predicted dehydrogenase
VYEHDSSTVSARLSGGALASGAFSLSTSPQCEVEIHGEKGRLLLSCYRFDGLAFVPRESYPGDLRNRLRDTAAFILKLGQAIPSLRRGGDFRDSFRVLWEHFVDCVCTDRQPECSLLDGQRAVQIAIAASQSARTGHSVRPMDVK